MIRFLLVFILFLAAQPWAQTQTPQRVVSLNMCLDPLLLQLLPPERLVSLTYLSGQSQLSAISDQVRELVQARGLLLNHGLAEELVPLAPDLILAGEFGATDAVALLQQQGYRVEKLGLPQGLADIASHLRQLGSLLGEEERAEAMASQLEQKLAQMDYRELPESSRPRALWYAPNGFVTGRFTLEDELMQRAGYRNLAAEQGLQGFVQLDLEALLTLAPEVLIVEAGYVESFSLAREYLHHPALVRNSRKLELPAALSVCAVPQVAEALASLVNARESQP